MILVAHPVCAVNIVTFTRSSRLMCCLQIIVMIALLVLVPLYYWYMLQPFYRRLGKESRRVAELLSQLPKSVDVQGNHCDLSCHILPMMHYISYMSRELQG